MYWGVVEYLHSLAQTNIITAYTTALTGSLLFWAIIILVVAYFLFPAFAETGRARYQLLRTGLQRLALILIPAIAALIIARLIQTALPLPRPFVALDTIPTPFSMTNSGSFPADQIAFLFALAYTLLQYRFWIAATTATAAVLAALGQLAAGVHWPIDIIIGVLFGLFSGVLGRWLIRIYAPAKLRTLDIEREHDRSK